MTAPPTERWITCLNSSEKRDARRRKRYHARQTSKILHPIQHPIAADLISECEMDTRYTSTESDDHIDVKIQFEGGRDAADRCSM
jgi:hypothetical protein